MILSRQVWLGGLVGGLALFVWGVVAWTLLPLGQTALKNLPDEERVVAALRASGASWGVYVIPGRAPRTGDPESDAKADAVRADKMRKGPTGVLVFDPDGTVPNRMFWPFARGLVFSLLAGTFAAWAISRARIGTHVGRIAFVLGLGLFAWVLGPGTQWVWFNYPPGYLYVTLAETVGGWLIVGIVQTGLVRP